jgi:hypothetical protein
MMESMESKQKENQKESDARVKELMERLAEVEMALKREKVKCLEFEAALAIERQNKRRAVDSPEEARGGKTRSTAPSQIRDVNSTPGVSASGLPVSRKFNPPLLSSVRSKDRQPPQETINAMMAPPPMPSIQIQPIIQPMVQPHQIQHASQQPVVLPASRFNRPTSYSRTVINVQGYHRVEGHINQSVGAWKKKLQDRGDYLPESETLSEGARESYLKQLSSALKNHFSWWVSHQCEGVHEDMHRQFKFLQATFKIPKHYENPDLWLPHHQENANHCLDFRCVSVWWYYDQAMRDIPGFQDNSTRQQRSTMRTTSSRTNQQHNQPSWGAPQNQHRQTRYSAIQENIAEAAAAQRQLALHHYDPEPHEDMDDLDSWDIHYDDLMLPDQRSQVKDLLHEIKRIKQHHPSKIYTDKRTRIINNAEEARSLDRNSPQIPHFLFNVKTPWSSGYGQANDAYDQHKIHEYEQRIAQLRNTNAQMCQMEISSSQHGPTGQDAL